MITKLRTIEIVNFGILAAILLVMQVAMAPLPNIEVVSVLVMMYTLAYGKKALYIIYVFAVLEGLIYGFGIWWFMYLYVWTILWGATMFFRKHMTPMLGAIILGFFGISFGALCSIPYFIIGGVNFGITYWVSGIPYDIIHGIANVVIGFVLYQPIYYVLKQVRKVGVQNDAYGI